MHCHKLEGKDLETACGATVLNEDGEPEEDPTDIHYVRGLCAQCEDGHGVVSGDEDIEPWTHVTEPPLGGEDGVLVEESDGDSSQVTEMLSSDCPDDDKIDDAGHWCLVFDTDDDDDLDEEVDAFVNAVESQSDALEHTSTASGALARVQVMPRSWFSIEYF